MNTRSVVTAMVVAVWALWSPLALATYMGAGGRAMCAVGSPAEAPSAAEHSPAHENSHKDKANTGLCSLGLCLTFISSGSAAEISLPSQAHTPPPPKHLWMAQLQIPDPVPKSFHQLA